MNVTLTSLEALILKATHESLPCPDAAALEAFCTIMRVSPEGPTLAAQALAARIHTTNPREALLALNMLDQCMRRCDATFHAEVGKFRFLNEMVKLVSPKYFADRTASEVQEKVLQLLHAWSSDYPKEAKFKVAYDMLKNQGVVKETLPPLLPKDAVPPTRSKSAIFEDEEKSKQLQKLLQSKKPEDILSANKLIKTMVREEERRSEASSRRALEVSSALDSMGLLQDMLRRASDATPDEIQIIHELKQRCAKMRPVLQRLAASDPPEDSLGDILHACDMLDEVIKKYNKFVADMKKKDNHRRKPQAVHSNDSLLDFAGAGDGMPKTPRNNVIDDIFSTDEPSIAEPLKPVSVDGSDDKDLVRVGAKAEKTEGWNELDSLGEQLLKQSLPENARRADSFKSKQTKKMPMNALEKSPNVNTQLTTNDALLDLDFFNKEPDIKNATSVARSVTPNDDVMVDISTDTPKSDNSSDTLPKPDCPFLDLGLSLGNENIETVESMDNSKENKDKKVSEVKPLTDINITLESVQPSKVAPLIVFEEKEGLTVTLHFCKDKPRPDVNVVVISTTSTSRSTIEDYKFQAVVPKGCKCRLLAPSGTSLPACNPFLPPPAITQVLLIARPAPPPPINLKFILAYTCDQETCSEIGEVMLPL